MLHIVVADRPHDGRLREVLPGQKNVDLRCGF